MVSADKDKEEIIQVPSELKTKLAHKRVGINRWSLTENAQREQLIKILEDYVLLAIIAFFYFLKIRS